MPFKFLDIKLRSAWILNLGIKFWHHRIFIIIRSVFNWTWMFFFIIIIFLSFSFFCFSICMSSPRNVSPYISGYGLVKASIYIVIGRYCRLKCVAYPWYSSACFIFSFSPKTWSSRAFNKCFLCFLLAWIFVIMSNAEFCLWRQVLELYVSMRRFV